MPVTRCKLLLRKGANCYQAWQFCEIHSCLQGGTQTSTITLQSKQPSCNNACHTAKLGLLYMKSSAGAPYGVQNLGTGNSAG